MIHRWVDSAGQDLSAGGTTELSKGFYLPLRDCCTCTRRIAMGVRHSLDLDRIILDLDFIGETYPPSAVQEESPYQRQRLGS